MLLVVAVVGNALLVPMGGIIGPIQVEYDLVGEAVSPSLMEIDVQQRDGESITGFDVDRLLQAGEGGLTGEIGLVG